MRTRSSLAAASLVLLLTAGCDPEPISDAGPTGADAGGSGTDAGASELDAGPPADTWTNFAQGFSQAYCVECHSAAPRDLSTLEGMRGSAATSRCGVSDVPLDDCTGFPPARQFPVGSGPRPSDDDRARFVRWIDNGLLE